MHGGTYAQRGFIFQKKVIVSLVLKHLWCLSEFIVEPKDDERVDFEISLSEKHSYYGESLKCQKLIAQIKSGGALSRSSSEVNKCFGETMKAFKVRFNSISDKDSNSFGILTENRKGSSSLGLFKTDLDLIRGSARSSTPYRERGKKEAIASVNKLFHADYDENFLRKVFVDDGFSFETGFGIDYLLKEIRFAVPANTEPLEPNRFVGGHDSGLADANSRVEYLIEQAILKGEPVTRFMVDSELVKSFKNCYVNGIVAELGKIEKEVPWWGRSLTVEAPGPNVVENDLGTRMRQVSVKARIVV